MLFVLKLHPLPSSVFRIQFLNSLPNALDYRIHIEDMLSFKISQTRGTSEDSAVYKDWFSHNSMLSCLRMLTLVGSIFTYMTQPYFL